MLDFGEGNAILNTYANLAAIAFQFSYYFEMMT